MRFIILFVKSFLPELVCLYNPSRVGWRWLSHSPWSNPEEYILTRPVINWQSMARSDPFYFKIYWPRPRITTNHPSRCHYILHLFRTYYHIHFHTDISPYWMDSENTPAKPDSDQPYDTTATYKRMVSLWIYCSSQLWSMYIMPYRPFVYRRTLQSDKHIPRLNSKWSETGVAELSIFSRLNLTHTQERPHHYFKFVLTIRISVKPSSLNVYNMRRSNKPLLVV